MKSFHKHALILSLIVLGYAFWASAEFKVIAAGIAIFLFGMRFLEDGFTAFTGGILERVLERSTNRLWKSLSFGLVTTSLMQSSSLVSVLSITFLSAGLIGLAQGIGIIFGANIGTTTGAWLMAAFGMKVKISAYAMPMLVFGLILVFQRRKELKGAGQILAGLGFLFLGIHYMKEGFETFRQTIDLATYAMDGTLGVFVFAGIGVFATVVMQSSHATLMLIIAALAAGQITYNNALALAIGANVGTTVTAMLGSVGANVAGKRLALAHLVFNTVTAVLAIVLLEQFRWAVDGFSAAVGIAADNWILKLAVFHSLFNVLGVVVMVPFISRLVRFLERRLSGPADPDVLEPLHLTEAALQLPDAAIEVIRRETEHLLDNAFEIVAHTLELHRSDVLSDRDIDDVVAESRTAMNVNVMDGYHRSIKHVYNAIIDFSARARSDARLTDDQLDALYDLRIVCRHVAEIVHRISHIQKNVSTYTRSDNDHIRGEYDKLRRELALILREVFVIRDRHDDVATFFTINQLSRNLERTDILADGRLDHLVRSQLITSSMATSLMNDSGTVHDINRRLIEIADRLFGPTDAALRQIGEELLMSEGEVPPAGSSGAGSPLHQHVRETAGEEDAPVAS